MVTFDTSNHFGKTEPICVNLDYREFEKNFHFYRQLASDGNKKADCDILTQNLISRSPSKRTIRGIPQHLADDPPLLNCRPILNNLNYRQFGKKCLDFQQRSTTGNLKADCDIELKTPISQSSRRKENHKIRQRLSGQLQVSKSTPNLAETVRFYNNLDYRKFEINLSVYQQMTMNDNKKADCDIEPQKPVSRSARKRKNRRMRQLLAVEQSTSNSTQITRSEQNSNWEAFRKANNLIPASNNVKQVRMTGYIGLDCEMVGIGKEGRDHMLARVSIVNRHKECIYDEYVQPTSPVVDYRTSVSGIRPHDIANGKPFQVVQNEVASIFKGRIIVGHSLKNDFSVLGLKVDSQKVRDTSKNQQLRKMAKCKSTPSLKLLSKVLLGKKIQEGEHCSVEDAKHAMELYLLVQKEWEYQLKTKENRHRKGA